MVLVDLSKYLSISRLKKRLKKKWEKKHSRKPSIVIDDLSSYLYLNVFLLFLILLYSYQSLRRMYIYIYSHPSFFHCLSFRSKKKDTQGQIVKHRKSLIFVDESKGARGMCANRAELWRESTCFEVISVSAASVTDLLHSSKANSEPLFCFWQSSRKDGLLTIIFESSF